MPVILITGAKGQVGTALQHASRHFPAWQFLFASRNELDISQGESVRKYFKDHSIDYCINCAAYTAVDKAEEEPNLAYKINAEGAMNLAQACHGQGSILLHLSSDYVYHGEKNTPFKESDPATPKSLYAKSKYEGEKLALEANPLTLIIRTSWIYYHTGHNFLLTMLRLAAERDHLKVVYDQIGSPTYAGDLAQALLNMIHTLEDQSDIDEWMGVYNYSNEGVTSWYDFAKAIFRMQNIPIKVDPIETKDYPTPAVRPPFSLMHKGKIKEAFQLDIPHWEDGLERCLAKV
jgi:dTDP-4-dehydrorhamnose reductase